MRQVAGAWAQAVQARVGDSTVIRKGPHDGQPLWCNLWRRQRRCHTGGRSPTCSALCDWLWDMSMTLRSRPSFRPYFRAKLRSINLQKGTKL